MWKENNGLRIVEGKKWDTECGIRKEESRK